MSKEVEKTVEPQVEQESLTNLFAFVNIKAIFSEEIVFDNDYDNVYTFKNALGTINSLMVLHLA